MNKEKLVLRVVSRLPESCDMEIINLDLDDRVKFRWNGSTYVVCSSGEVSRIVHKSAVEDEITSLMEALFRIEFKCSESKNCRTSKL